MEPTVSRVERALLTPPAVGLHDVPMHEYLAWDAVSAGLVKDVLARGPAYADRARRCPRPETDATERGTAVHAAILEPEAFERRYACLSQDCNLSRTDGRAEKAEIIRAGKHPLKAKVWEACVALRERAWAHPTLAALLGCGTTETSALAALPTLEGRRPLLGKARADLYAEEASTIVDLKTTEDASPFAFGATAAGYGYHLSAPWYLDVFAAAGSPIRYWTLAALECDDEIGHYDVRLYTLDPGVLAAARQRIQKALAIWETALSTGRFHSTDAFVPLSLPTWTFQE